LPFLLESPSREKNLRAADEHAGCVFERPFQSVRVGNVSYGDIAAKALPGRRLIAVAQDSANRQALRQQSTRDVAADFPSDTGNSEHFPLSSTLRDSFRWSEY
jgi:hypothetical protein